MIGFNTRWPNGSFNLDSSIKTVENHYSSLVNQSLECSDMLGWLDLPRRMEKDGVERVKSVAEDIRQNADCFVSTGIGGSYLGGRAVVEALKPYRTLEEQKPAIYFAGQNISGHYHKRLLERLENETYYVNVISKSGTTTETALAFRLLLNKMRDQNSDDQLQNRVIATTDQSTGALREACDEFGFRRFVIPDDVGGRFSVLSPVGLLPMAVAGIDVDDLIAGAREASRSLTSSRANASDAIRYAGVRHLLFQEDYSTEIFANFYPELSYLGKWWQQLFGESEGKKGKGLFPATVDFTTDLHSMGQFIQDGPRNIFETIIRIEARPEDPTIPDMPRLTDGFDYLSGESLEKVNKEALEGTLEAHVEGGIPVNSITLEQLNARTMGKLLFFLEFSCALSALALGVNPFNQPGVERYKDNMNQRLKAD